MKMISIIIPAMNEGKVVGSVIQDVRMEMDKLGLEYEVILVDDGSRDDTGVRAKEVGARVIRHAYNMGNGAAIKSGIRHAKGDIVVMMDADGQHDPRDIQKMLQEIDDFGMVVGARTRESDSDWYRDIANIVYNRFASYICGYPIPDLTSGFRAIHTSLVRRFLYLLPNTFSYPTTITLSVFRAGHCVKYVPIKAARRVGKSKIKLLRDGSRFILIIVKIAMMFSPIKVFLPVSIGIFTMGLLWYFFYLLTYGPKMPNASVIMFVSGIMFFLMGLISEQIAQLRYDRSEDGPLNLFDTDDIVTVEDDEPSIEGSIEC